MSHGHDHAAPAAEDSNKGRLLLVVCITAAVFVAEVVGAWLTGSLALLADAGHMLTDIAGLLLALLAANLVTKPVTSGRTWGFRRAETLAAGLQALLLLAVGVYVFIEGIRRLFEPPEVASVGMLVFGIIGLAGNVIGLAVLMRSRSANLNLRAAFLEVLNDALGSVAVIVAAIIITTTGWTRADAVVSLLIAVLIVPRTISLLRDVGRVLLESTPRGLDLDEVRRHILEVPHVLAVHDLHASQIATGLPVLTAHVVVDDKCFYDGHLAQLLDDMQTCVSGHFPISVEHSTFQFEKASHANHEAAHH